MSFTKIKWLTNDNSDELLLTLGGVTVGRVRPAAEHEIPGWYWHTLDAALPGGARVPGDCVADGPAASLEQAKAQLLACVRELLAEDAVGNGR